MINTKMLRLNYSFLVYCIFFSQICLFLLLGVLGSLDGYMNIVLEQTEEYVNGQVFVNFMFL